MSITYLSQSFSPQCVTRVKHFSRRTVRIKFPGPGNNNGTRKRKRRGVDAGKGRNLRGKHGGAAAADGGADARAAEKGAGGRGRGPGGADLREPPAGAVGCAALRRARREHGRPVPGGGHRPHQGRGLLRPEPECPVFHLRRSSDYGMAKSGGKRRPYRLRHLPDNPRPCFVPFPCNTQSIPAEKRHRRNTDSLGICSRRQDRRLPERSLFP